MAVKSSNTPEIRKDDTGKLVKTEKKTLTRLDSSFPLFSGAPLLSKFGNLSMRENLVVTSAYARQPVQTLGGGGESQFNPTGGGECHFSWRKIA